MGSNEGEVGKPASLLSGPSYLADYLGPGEAEAIVLVNRTDACSSLPSTRRNPIAWASVLPLVQREGSP